MKDTISCTYDLDSIIKSLMRYQRNVRLHVGHKLYFKPIIIAPHVFPQSSKVIAFLKQLLLKL